MKPQTRKMAGLPVDFQEQIDYLIDHPEDFNVQWCARVGIFDVMPGRTGGAQCCCPVFVKDGESRHPLEEEIQADPLIECPVPIYLREFKKLPEAKQREILNRYRYYQEKSREMLTV